MLPNKDKPQMFLEDPKNAAAIRSSVRASMEASVVHDQPVINSRPRVLVLGGGINTEVRRALNAVFRVQTLVRAPAITREEAAERQKVAERAAWNAAVTRKKWTGK